MWTKIYPAFLAVALAAMGVLTYLPYSWLQSRGFAPNVIAENFLSYSGTFWTALGIFSLALLIAANVILWTSRRAWALWVTLLFFSVFVLVRTWWLNELYVGYAGQNNLSAETPFGLGILGALFCIAAAAGIFFNQFLVLRMRDRIHGAPQPPEEAVVTDENPREENPREENT